MNENDKPVPTGNTAVDAAFAVRIKADFLYNGRQLTQAHLERMVREALRREFDTLDCKITVVRQKSGQ